MSKTNEYLWNQFREDVGAMRIGASPITKGEAIEIAFRKALTAKDKEREEAVQREAYLWFNTWFSRTIKPGNQDFGKWASERLQTFGAEKLSDNK